MATTTWRSWVSARICLIRGYIKLRVTMTSAPESLSWCLIRLDLCFAAIDILVQRNVEALNQVGTIPLDKPGHVFGEVLTGLGHEIPQSGEHLIAHAILVGHPTLLHHPAYRRIEVLAVPLKPEEEGHVIDSGSQVVDLL